jgi:hypothetical protein
MRGVCGYCNTCLLKLFFFLFSFSLAPVGPVAACQRGSVLQPPSRSAARWLHPKLRCTTELQDITPSPVALPPLFTPTSRLPASHRYSQRPAFPAAKRVISCVNTGGGQLALIFVHLNTWMAFDRSVIHRPQRQPLDLSAIR